MIHRKLEKQVKDAALSFQVVAVSGPGQSVKTTLVQKVFNRRTYISLEDLDIRQKTKSDLRLFLQVYPKDGIILDEIQHVPELLSYIF
jgi:predicted AAA+ superfamily ATPase